MVAALDITQTGSEVIAAYDSPTQCPEGGLNDADPYLEFKGTIDGNQIIGKESSWCYKGSSNPDQNGLFIDPFRVTISDNGNKLTLFANNRFTEEEDSQGYAKSLQPTIKDPQMLINSVILLIQQSHRLKKFLINWVILLIQQSSQVKETASALQQNDLPQLLLLAGLAVTAIGGTTAYVKHRSSKKSQQNEQANIEVITRGGLA